jgi:virulence-associated protein VapD
MFRLGGLKMKAASSKRQRHVRLVRDRSEPDDVNYIANRLSWGKRVYAICFDLDTETLKNQYHNISWQNAYTDIGRVLERHGFNRQQGSVYFGDEKVDPIRCVLAVQEVTSAYPWFRMAVTDIRMLRIEENNDLMPAVGVAELPFASTAAVAAT